MVVGGRGVMTLMLEEDALSAFRSAGDIELDFHVRDAPEASVATLLNACASTSKLSSPKRPRSHSRALDCVGPRELIARKYGTAAPLFAFRTIALVMMAKFLGTSKKGDSIFMECGDLVVILQACANGRDGLHPVHLVRPTQLTIHKRAIGGTFDWRVKSTGTVETPSR